jgi:prepilin-type N-terminal cleavage/methylation domain-containing protein
MSASIAPPSPRAQDRLKAERGFSFVEILVVMGIIGVLTGIGLAVYGIVIKKQPQIKTKALLMKITAEVDHLHSQFRAYPPTDFNAVGVRMGLDKSIKYGKVPNTTNTGIESLYQCLFLPGFTQKPDFNETELGNLDGDELDKLPDASRPKALFEILDAWGNPLAYFDESSYIPAEKNPHDYSVGTGDDEGSIVPVKPWRSATGAFAQPGKYQIFSWGPDRKPNTEDDVKAWE